MKYKDGPQIIYSCRGCYNLSSGKYPMHYWCGKYDDLIVLTTLKTPEDCPYLINIKRKQKLENLKK
jgi:hypothetical protein